MADKKDTPGFMIWRKAAIIYSLMSDEDAAKVIKATANYFLYGLLPKLDGVAASVFEIMKADIDYERLQEGENNG